MKPRKTRLQIQQDSVARRQVLLSYVEKHGPISTAEIVDALTAVASRSIINQWLRGMEADEHVICVQFTNSRGHLENSWARGHNKSPLPFFKVGGMKEPIREVKERRRFTKAEQIGMQRCEFESLFFGAVGA